MLYVTDRGNHRVCVFDQHSTYFREFGRKSSAYFYGRRFDPTCIHIDHDPSLSISQGTATVDSLFDTDGKYMCAVDDRPECEVGTSLQPFAFWHNCGQGWLCMCENNYILNVSPVCTLVCLVRALFLSKVLLHSYYMCKL